METVEVISAVAEVVSAVAEVEEATAAKMTASEAASADHGAQKVAGICCLR
jgi:hypothetical protein